MKGASRIIIKRGSKYLLVERARGQPFSRFWEFPGGKIDRSETPMQTAKRELLEETGLKIKLKFVKKLYDRDTDAMVHYFKGKTKRQYIILGSECSSYNWVRSVDFRRFWLKNGYLLTNATKIYFGSGR